MNVLQNGIDLQGQDVLRFYTSRWDKYQFSSKVMNDFCGYINRHWVQREYNSGHKDIYDIYTVQSLQLFHSIISIFRFRWPWLFGKLLFSSH